MEGSKSIVRIVLAFILCSAGASLAQRIAGGNTYNFDRSWFPIKFAGVVNGEVILVKARADDPGIIKELSLDIFNESTRNHIRTVELEGLFSDRISFFPEDVFVWNGQLYYVGSAFAKTNLQNHLLIKPAGADFKPGPADTLYSFRTGGLQHDRKRFRLCSNPGQTYLVAVSSGIPAGPGPQVAMFDSSLKFVREMQLPGDQNIELVEGRVDDYGNVYLLTKAGSREHSSYTLYAFPVMTGEVISYVLDIPGKSINGVAFCLDNDDNIMLSGLAGENDLLSSFFFIKIDRETGDVIGRNLLRLDASLGNHYIGDSRTPARAELQNLKIQSLLPDADGGALLLAEDQTVKELCVSDPRTGLVNCDWHFSYNDILVFKLGKNAEPVWFNLIPKKQIVIGEEESIFLSYQVVPGEDGLLFFFNTNRRAERKGGIEKSEAGIFELTKEGRVLPKDAPLSRETALVPLRYSGGRGRYFLFGLRKGTAALFSVERP